MGFQAWVSLLMMHTLVRRVWTLQAILAGRICCRCDSNLSAGLLFAVMSCQCRPFLHVYRRTVATERSHIIDARSRHAGGRNSQPMRVYSEPSRSTRHMKFSSPKLSRSCTSPLLHPLFSSATLWARGDSLETELHRLSTDSKDSSILRRRNLGHICQRNSSQARLSIRYARHANRRHAGGDYCLHTGYYRNPTWSNPLFV